MKNSIDMFENFGDFCANGDNASRFLQETILPTVHNGSIEFNFKKVRNMNSSFANALFANLIAIEGAECLERIHFKHCNNVVRVLVSSALEMGLQKQSEILKSA